MNFTGVYLACLISSAAGLEPKSAQPQPVPPGPPAPPPVTKAQSAVGSPEKYVYEQKVAGGRSYIVTPEQAQAIINRFKESYAKLGNPRVLIYINRELIDENSGMKLSARKVQTETARGEAQLKNAASPGAQTNGAIAASGSTKSNSSGPSERVSSENTYRFRERQAPTLADRQTTRDVERLFGRPLRLAGVALVDQQIASQTIGDRPLDAFRTSTESEQTRRDRETLLKVADVVVELLMSSRNVTIAEVSGDKVYSVPDLQATAIRLKDARILGQATGSDVIGRGGRAFRPYDVNEITEATALSLMEDMLTMP